MCLFCLVLPIRFSSLVHLIRLLPRNLCVSMSESVCLSLCVCVRVTVCLCLVQNWVVLPQLLPTKRNRLGAAVFRKAVPLTTGSSD
jgi:hypothetical protein